VGALEVAGVALQPDNWENYARYRLEREVEGSTEYNYWDNILKRIREQRNNNCDKQNQK
jgi:hypothetical protein